MRVHNEDLTLTDTDMTEDITSSALNLSHVANYSIQLVYSGSPNGAFKLQASNDFGSAANNIPSASITNWTDVASTSTNVTSAGSLLYNFSNAGYKWVRVVWTDSSSGTSSITVARFTTKGV